MGTFGKTRKINFGAKLFKLNDKFIFLCFSFTVFNMSQ